MFLIILNGLAMEAVIVIVSAIFLVTVTLGFHVAGLVMLLRWLRPYFDRPPTRVLPMARVLIRIATGQILAHLITISVWAVFYLWQDCLPNSEAAFYFSGGTYTTAGSGDLMLARPWRLLAPLEALVGILMCALSASIFFAVVNHFHRAARESLTKSRSSLGSASWGDDGPGQGHPRLGY